MFAIGTSTTNHVRLFKMDKNKNDVLYQYQYTPIAALNFLDKPVYTIDFSNDGDYLAYSGADGNISILSYCN